MFANSTLATNANGTFDYAPGTGYHGWGALTNALGTFCIAFKGTLAGFEMGFNYSRLWLGVYPSIFYSWQPTCPGCPYGCAAERGHPCLVTHGADKSMHQLQGEYCTVWGASGIYPTSPLKGLAQHNQVFFVSLAVFIASGEWQSPPNAGSQTMIFEFFEPILKINFHNDDLSQVHFDLNTASLAVPFHQDAWWFCIFGVNLTGGSGGFLNVSTVDPNPQTGSWLVDPVVTQWVSHAGLDGNVRGVSVDWGIYRGKLNASQKIHFGQVNFGPTWQSVMPQLQPNTAPVPTLLFWFSASTLQPESASNPTVTSWPDSSGLGYTATAYTQPHTPNRWPTLNKTAMNGHPGLQYNGAFFQTAAQIPLGASFSCVAVATLAASSSVIQMFLGAQTAGGWGMGVSNSSLSTFVAAHTLNPGRASVPQGQAVVLSFTYDYHNVSWLFYLGGCAIGEVQGFYEWQDVTVQLGCRDGNDCWQGAVSEIKCSRGVLSAADRQSNESAFSAQYGLSYPAFSYSSSPVSVNTSSVPADGVSVALITVTVLNGLNELVLGAEIGLQSSRPNVDTITAVTAVSGNDGTVSFLVSSSAAGVSSYFPYELNSKGGSDGQSLIFLNSVSVEYLGLLFWYSAQRLSADGLHDGERLQSWPDSSANNYTATKPSDGTDYGLPVYYSQGLSGQPTVAFDASTRTALQMPSLLPVSPSSYTLIVVLSVAEADRQSQWLLASTTEQSFLFGVNGSLFVDVRNSETSGVVSSSFQLTGQLAALVSVQFDSSSGQFSFFVNGAAAGSANSSAHGGIVGADVQLGCDSASAGCFNGNVSEVLMLNYAPSTTVRRQYERMLGSPYGL